MSGTSNHPRFICLTLEAPEIIEMKQAMLDRDSPGTADFFWRVVVPRVQEAARRRGISLSAGENNDDRLPG